MSDKDSITDGTTIILIEHESISRVRTDTDARTWGNWSISVGDTVIAQGPAKIKSANDTRTEARP